MFDRSCFVRYHGVLPPWPAARFPAAGYVAKGAGDLPPIANAWHHEEPDVTEQSVRALLIQDDPGEVILAERSLAASAGQTIRLETVSSLTVGLDRLAKRETDVLVLDLHLPDCQGDLGHLP